MKRSFKPEFREDHIHVEITSDFKLEPEWEDEFWRAIRALCNEHDSRRVLVEGFAPLDEREPSEVIESGMRATVVPNLWLAISFKNFEPNNQSELFAVIAARSGVRVKFFSNSGKALKWLRVNAPA